MGLSLRKLFKAREKPGERVHRMAWIRQTSWGITSQSILESSLRPVIPLRSISSYCRTDWTMERITWTR